VVLVLLAYLLSFIRPHRKPVVRSPHEEVEAACSPA
jgi:hypothetical protein